MSGEEKCEKNKKISIPNGIIIRAEGWRRNECELAGSFFNESTV